MAKLNFKKLVGRINGVSTPVFGVSWNPSVSDSDIARKLIYFLEDKRALYYPFGMEIPYHVNESVFEIRKHFESFPQLVAFKTIESQSQSPSCWNVGNSASVSVR